MKRLLLLTALIALVVGCGPVKDTNTDTKTANKEPLNNPQGPPTFVIKMFDKFPAKFEGQRVAILAEGVLIKTIESPGVLDQLSFTIDRSEIDTMVSEKKGKSKNQLEVMVRLTPISGKGKEQPLIAIFDLRKAKYVKIWGGRDPERDDPQIQEKTNTGVRN